MGRSPCCDKVGLKKGPWTPEEDQKLLSYIEEHGHGSWRALPAKAGLQRCGKSCRLRWTNYLRPDIKRGKFSFQEEQTIIQLHALLGNRWSAIATHLPKRTDNEIKNYWNTHLKKRLTKMGIDPVTHKPKNDALLSSDGQSKNTAKLSHMAQWESARLEAEARLVRESKLRSHSFNNHSAPGSSSYPGGSPAAVLAPAPASAQLGQSAAASSSPQSLDVLRTWGGGAWPKSGEGNGNIPGNGIGSDLESPTSTLTFSECAPPLVSGGIQEHSKQIVDFVATSGSGSGSNSISGSSGTGLIKADGENDWKGMANSVNLPDYKECMPNSVSFTSTFHDMTMSALEGTWTSESIRPGSAHCHMENEVEEGFTNLLLNSSGDTSSYDGSGDSDNGSDGGNGGGSGSGCYEDNKNYWNSILNLVNSSPSQSPMF